MTQDITTILYRIKENIGAIEAGAEDELRLEEVRSDFLDFMELAKLFMISERDSYYGYFLMNMDFRVNYGSRSIAGIKLNEFPPVFESNPLLLCKFSIREILYIICHEIDHVMLNHPAEMVRANPTGDEQTFYEFNLAADAAVNDRINYEIEAENHNYLSAPEGAVTSDVIAQKYELCYVAPMENYAYYFEMIRGRKNEDGQDENLNPSSNAADDGSEIVTALNCGELEDHNWEVGEDGDFAEAAVRELVNSAVGMMSEESRGMMPAYFLSQIQRINRPPVLSWQVILKKYIGTLSANKRHTRTRLNRRQPERFDLSGQMDDKVLKLVVAIDTSGSVSDEMIGQIFNEIFGILAKRKHDITVIECDAEVQRVYKAKTPADIQQKVSGRGGTLFSPAIEYINKDKYFRDALLIYFTDGYGESEIPKPRTYRNIWVVFDDPRHLSLGEPYGAVLKL